MLDIRYLREKNVFFFDVLSKYAIYIFIFICENIVLSEDDFTEIVPS